MSLVFGLSSLMHHSYRGFSFLWLLHFQPSQPSSDIPLEGRPDSFESPSCALGFLAVNLFQEFWLFRPRETPLRHHLCFRTGGVSRDSTRSYPSTSPDDSIPQSQAFNPVATHHAKSAKKTHIARGQQISLNPPPPPWSTGCRGIGG